MPSLNLGERGSHVVGPTAVPSTPRSAAAVITSAQPRPVVKLSGIGLDCSLVDMKRESITGISTELNTPDIERDDVLAEPDYNYKCSSLIQDPGQMGINIRASLSSPVNNHGDSTAVFDWSPHAMDCEESVESQNDGNLLNDSMVTSCSNEASSRPMSPSDFLNNPTSQAGGEVLQRASSPDQSLLESLPDQSLLDDIDKIPPHILDQITQLCDSFPADGLDQDSTALDLQLGSQDLPEVPISDILGDALQQSGLTTEELCLSVEEEKKCAGNSYTGNTLETSAMPQLHVTPFPVLTPACSVDPAPQTQPTFMQPTLVQQTHTEPALFQPVPTQVTLVHPTLTQPISAALTHPTAVSPLLSQASSCHSIDPQPSTSKGHRSESDIGPIRVTRQRREVRKPSRFRENVAIKEVEPANYQEIDDEFSLDDEFQDLAADGTTVRRQGRHGGGSLTDKEKYLRSRELNNLASKRCRENRRKKQQEREQIIETLETENKRLKAQEALIQKQVDKLKKWMHYILNLPPQSRK